MHSGKRRTPARGFTYVAVLLWVALVGIGLAVTGEVWHTTAQREREDELLFIGSQFRRALDDYFRSSPGVPSYPKTLQELVKDERFPDVRRHLRRVYLDPMTGKAEWGLVRQPGGGIVAVFSLSTARPLRTANFRGRDEEFTGRKKYSEWIFRADAAPGMAPAATGTTPGVPPAATSAAASGAVSSTPVR